MFLNLCSSKSSTAVGGALCSLCLKMPVSQMFLDPSGRVFLCYAEHAAGRWCAESGQRKIAMEPFRNSKCRISNHALASARGTCVHARDSDQGICIAIRFDQKRKANLNRRKLTKPCNCRVHRILVAAS